MMVLLNHRLDCLAAGRSPTTKQGLHLVPCDQFFSLLRAIVGIRAAVRNDHLDLRTVNPARLVGLFHCQPHRIYQRRFAHCHRAAERVQHADFYIGFILEVAKRQPRDIQQHCRQHGGQHQIDSSSIWTAFQFVDYLYDVAVRIFYSNFHSKVMALTGLPSSGS